MAHDEKGPNLHATPGDLSGGDEEVDEREESVE